MTRISHPLKPPKSVCGETIPGIAGESQEGEGLGA